MRNNKFKHTTKRAVERYNNRYTKFGKCAKSLGWGNENQQLYRFDQVLSAVDLSNKSILDIGCGFGDFCGYMQSKDIMFANYIGWDINENFLLEAKKRYHYKFNRVDLLTYRGNKPITNVVVMLGLLNFNLGSQSDNIEYSKKMIARAFELTNEILVVDFLSIYLSAQYPKEDGVFYHDPSYMLDYALTMTQDVQIIHNYNPIPQKEFLLVLYK